MNKFRRDEQTIYVHKLEVKIEILKKAVEFYAERTRWGYDSNPRHEWLTLLETDEQVGGEVARQALKEIEKLDEK